MDSRSKIHDDARDLCRGLLRGLDSDELRAEFEAYAEYLGWDTRALEALARSGFPVDLVDLALDALVEAKWPRVVEGTTWADRFFDPREAVLESLEVDDLGEWSTVKTRRINRNRKHGFDSLDHCLMCSRECIWERAADRGLCARCFRAELELRAREGQT